MLTLKNKSRQVLSTTAATISTHASRNETKRPEVQIDLKWSWPRNRSSKTVIKALSKETKESAMPKWLEERKTNKQPSNISISSDDS